MKITLFTVGYEDAKSPDHLVEQLLEAGVERLVDVRARAQSRKRGFSKNGLSDTLADAGIAYEHWPELGNPVEIRALYRAGDVPAGREAYQAHVRNGSAWAIESLAGSLASSSTCLLCLETDHTLCHRDIVVAEVLVRTPDLRIVHLV